MRGTEKRKWIREELILAFSLYCRTPFGRLHGSNPDIVSLAKKLERTPSALAMKLCNFASMDPAHAMRKVKGLANASKNDRNIWDEFHSNWDTLSVESQYILDNIDYLLKSDQTRDVSKKQYDNTEITRSVKVRIVQKFFRDAVLASYNIKCALCHLNLPELLNASHIIPWRICVEKRADPTNGISLCVLHDRAFDKGLISFNESYEVILSKRIKASRPLSAILKIGLLDFEGVKISLPSRFFPDKDAMSFHREQIFQI
jgi:putative restriction endonuclease